MTATPSADDDVDIYEDLLCQQPEESEQNVQTLKEENKLLKERVSSLEAHLQSLQTKVISLRNSNKNLSSNISVLFNTAKAENIRKENAISSLREQLNNLLFRRNKKKSTQNTVDSEVCSAVSAPEEESVTNLSEHSIAISKNKAKVDSKKRSKNEEREVYVESNLAEPVSDNCHQRVTVEKKHDHQRKDDYRSSFGSNQTRVSQDTKNDKNMVSMPSYTDSNTKIGKTASVISQVLEKGNNNSDSNKSKGSAVKRKEKASLSTEEIVATGLEHNCNRTENESMSRKKSCMSSNIVNKDTKHDARHEVFQTSSTFRTNEVPSVNSNGTSSPDSNKENKVCEKIRNLQVEEILNRIHNNVKKTASRERCNRHLPKQMDKVVLPEGENKVTAKEQNAVGSTVKNPCHDYQKDNIKICDVVQQEVLGDKAVIYQAKKDGLMGDSSTTVIAASTVFPPLPDGDPAPLPPLPLDSPLKTPVKVDANTLNKEVCSKENEKSLHEAQTPVQSLNVDFRSSNEQAETSQNMQITEEDHMATYLQFPFRVRRRVKSIVIIESVDSTAINSQKEKNSDIKKKNSQFEDKKEYCSGGERYSTHAKPSSASHKQPGRKDEISESKHYDSRTTSRPSYNSRHSSSSKLCALTPERRSPSELFYSKKGYRNERDRKGCKIETMSHQDEIRTRIRDHRSKSHSPTRRYDRYERSRGEDYYSRELHSSRINSNRRYVKEDQSCYHTSKRVDSKKLEETPPFAVEGRLTRSRAKLATKSVSEEQKDRSTTRKTVHSSFNILKAKTDTERKEGRINNEKSSQIVSHVNNVHDTGSDTICSKEAVPHIIVVKRKSRAFVNLEESEAVPVYRNPDAFKGDTLKQKDLHDCEASSVVRIQCQESPRSSHAAKQTVPSQLSETNTEETILKPRLSVKSNSTEESTHNPKLSVKSSSTEESTHSPKFVQSSSTEETTQNPRLSVSCSTPLYFREQINKQRSKSSSGDECFSEFEDSPSSVDSDDSYKPGYSRKRTKKMDGKQNTKRKAIQN